MTKPDEELKIWILTPANIPEYCKKTGEPIDKMMAKYRLAAAENKILYGYIASENLWR